MINDLKIRKAGERDINISWTLENFESVILCNVLANQGGICKTIGVDKSTNNLTIQNLDIGLIYEIQIRVLTETGWHTSDMLEVSV